MSAEARSIEERVAALEERVAHPLLAISAPELSEEDQARFREAFDEAMTGGGWKYEVLPPAPPLTPDQVRSLLRECVTVVKPGETLIIRVEEDWSQQQVHDLQMRLHEWIKERGQSFRVLIVPGAELGVAEAPAHPFPGGPFSPIMPVPVDEPPGGWRPEPRKFQYHVGGTCGAPNPDGTCGCASREPSGA